MQHRTHYVGTCPVHNKKMWPTRASAKRVARMHNGHKNVFACSVNPTYFHVGELSPVVISGIKSRAETYRWAA